MSNKKFSDTSIPLNLKNKSEEIKKMFVKIANESYDKGMSISQSINTANKIVTDFEKMQLAKASAISESVDEKLKETIKKRIQEAQLFEIVDERDEELEELNKAADSLLSDDVSAADFDEYGRLVITLESGRKITTKKALQKEQIEQNIVVTNDNRPFIEMQEPTGFKTRSTSQISFNNSTRTFTISATGNEFNVWLHAREFTRQSESVQIENISGTHYIYFDYPDNELKSTMIATSDLFLSTALVAIVYWRADQQKAIYFADERHGIVMDGATHRHLHLSFGAQYISGLALYNFQADNSGSFDSHAQFACRNGVIADEDLTFNIIDNSPQNLAEIANLPVYYRIGSGTTYWYKKEADAFPLITPGDIPQYSTGTRPCYNHLVGSTWQVSQVANNHFMLIHVLATNDVNHPVIAILGNSYATKSEAREAIQTELIQITDIPMAEFVKLGSVIYQCADSYTNSVKSKVVSIDGTIAYYDFRDSAYAPAISGGGGTDTNTTYSLSAQTDVTGALVRLTDSDNTNYDVKLIEGNNIDVALTGVNSITISSTSDMSKSVYDTDNDGKVDSAEVADTALAVDWNNVTSKPTTFAPSTHNHVMADITDLDLTVSWGEILDKPSVFAPDTHFHVMSDITDLDLTVTWTEVLDKPLTFPPSTHNHVMSDITDLDLTVTWTEVLDKPLTFPPSTHFHVMSDITDLDLSVTWTEVLDKPLTFPPSSHVHVMADITDLDLTVTWNEILDKPATFTPSAHTHVSADITDLSTTISGFITSHEEATNPHPQYTSVVEIANVTGDIHGVVDRTASALSFDESTRTFTIAPTSASWTFYYHGVFNTITSSKSIVIANTTGARFIKIDPVTLNLIEGGPVPDFAQDVIVAYIYWNATTSQCIILGDERHGYKRDTTWHSNQHLNVGTIWRSGGSLTYTLDNQSSIQIGVGTPLIIADEDLTHSINHSATPSADYQQILNGAASLEVLYLNGTGYTRTTASTTPWIAGTSLARYNLVTAGSGSLVDAPEGSYITYWLLATNDTRSPVKLVLGRTPHASIDAAYAETFEEYGLSFAEQVFMQQIVVKTSSAYTGNAAKIVIAGVRKVLSKLATTASTVSATQHNNLTGRDVADVHPISSITGLETVLSGKQETLVSGTSIKTINSTSILGSGNIDVQPTLVSGTNIKSINNSTVLGSGNIDLQTPLVSGTSIKTINSTSVLGSGNIDVQPTLVSGTSIKTINNTTVLGSGNIDVQPTLVSGTSIKTINNASVLGSGNIDVQPTLVSGTNIKTVNGTSVLGSGDITTPNTSYSLAAATTTGGANLNLNGSDTTTDTIKFAQSKFATVTQTDANTITVGTTYNITVGTAAPSTPSIGDIWIDTN